MSERDRERETVSVSLSQMYFIMRVGSCNNTHQKPEGMQRWNQDNPQDGPRPEATHLCDIHLSIPGGEGERPQMGCPQPKGENPREPEVMGTRPC